jgi:glycosyltransferase involved in cell wall biosynthesis
MRIMFVNWSRCEFGGGEKHLLALMKELAGTGTEVMLLCPAGSPLAEKAISQNIPVKELAFVFFEKCRPWEYITSVISIYKQVKIFRPDIIHAQGANSLEWLMPLVWLTNMKVCCLFQDFEVESRFSRWALPRISSGIADSEAVRGQLIVHYGLDSDRCLTIKQAIESMPETDRARTRELRRMLNLDSCDIAVGLCGRIHPRKGQRLFILASAVLKGKNNIKWFIAGDRQTADPEFLAELDDLIKQQGPGLQLSFTGFITNMSEFLDALDIVAVPSHKEPLGLISVEAQAKQRPVIVSGEGGLPETLIRDVSGIIMEEYTPECLARHVASLADDKQKRTRMGRAGREYYLREFTISQNAQKISEHYASLLRSR